VLDEAMDHLREARQRIRATQNLLRSQGILDDNDYRELITRLSTALGLGLASEAASGLFHRILCRTATIRHEGCRTVAPS
jgi:hypothetical protein